MTDLDTIQVQYLRGAGNLIEVTIAWTDLDRAVAFGFAYRSPKDPPDKLIGSSLAEKRAMGMCYADLNGVQGLLQVAPFRKRGKILKAYLGSQENLLQKLVEVDNQYSAMLVEKVKIILAKINRARERKEREFADQPSEA